MTKLLRRGDLLLLGVLLCGALLWLLLSRGGGDAASVTVAWDGREVAVLPLGTPDRLEVNGVVIVVGGGACHVERSTCPDGLCVRQGEISRSGESIVCLPNRVTVTAHTAEAPEVDAVT